MIKLIFTKPVFLICNFICRLRKKPITIELCCHFLNINMYNGNIRQIKTTYVRKIKLEKRQTDIVYTIVLFTSTCIINWTICLTNCTIELLQGL